MIASLKNWFVNLTRREQSLITILLLLTVAITGYYLIYIPLHQTTEKVKQAHAQTVSDYGEIQAKVSHLETIQDKQNIKETTDKNLPLDIFIGQSAIDLGFTLTKNELRGDQQVDIIIDTARSQPLFTWLNQLEQKDIITHNLYITNNNNTVSAEITLVRKIVS